MTFDPGRVRLSLTMADGVVCRTEVACERPAVARLLHGQPAEQAVALVPLIYSLCGKAQGIAARAALAAARGNAGTVHIDAEAWVEAAREHAWKLLVDWPKQLGLAPDEGLFVRIMRAPAADMIETLDRSLAWTSGLSGGSEIDRLFSARVAERSTALRDWLAGRPDGLGSVNAHSEAPGVGEARVGTARGPLLHRLVLEGERIADYAITAPTDVHFAAGGDVARWLEQLRGLSRREAERQARLLVLAFDPCVPWELA